MQALFHQRLSIALGFCSTVALAAPASALAALALEVFTLPPFSGGNTHEIVPGVGRMWVPQPSNDLLVRLGKNGQMTLFDMPEGAEPHGIEFDKRKRMWVSFEGVDKLAQVDPKSGKVLDPATGEPDEDAGFVLDTGTDCPATVGPHGLDVSDDAKTLWFAGKEGSVVGSVDIESGATRCFATGGPKPIYVRLDQDGNAWSTILEGDAGDNSLGFTNPPYPSIGVVTTSGKQLEYTLEGGLVFTAGAGQTVDGKTFYDQRPITIVRDPKIPNKMWFSLEQGGRIASIQLKDAAASDQDDIFGVQYFSILAMLQAGGVTTGCETPQVAADAGSQGGFKYTNANRIQIAGIGFDNKRRLWVTMNCGSAGSWIGVANRELTSMQAVQVSSTNSVLHRIHTGLGGRMWFSEEGVDRAGNIRIK